MSKKVKVEINYAGVGEILKSSGMEEFLLNEAKTRASSLGSGYGTSTYHAGTRVIASISTLSQKAAKENLEKNTLLKAVSSYD